MDNDHFTEIGIAPREFEFGGFAYRPRSGRFIEPSLERAVRAAGWDRPITAYILRPVMLDDVGQDNVEYSLALGYFTQAMCKAGFKKSMHTALDRKAWPEGWEGLPERINPDELVWWAIEVC